MFKGQAEEDTISCGKLRKKYIVKAEPGECDAIKIKGIWSFKKKVVGHIKCSRKVKSKQLCSKSLPFLQPYLTPFFQPHFLLNHLEFLLS